MKKSHSRPVLLAGALASTLVALCLFLILRDRKPSRAGAEITLHCAAGLRLPVAEIARRYQEEYGTPVRIQFGGSGELASQLAVAGGDLYLPADLGYIESTRRAGLVRESIPALTLTAGIVLSRGNPKTIGSIDDLARSDVRVSLADPSAAVGSLTRAVLQEAGLWTTIKANAAVFKPTVNNVAEDVSLGAVDAGIVWDAVAAQFGNLEFLRVPLFDARPTQAAIGVLAASPHPAEALRFARYLTASDRGLPLFQRHHFATEAGDPWSLTPEITLFSGSMLRPAIREQLASFEQREGVRVQVIYEGCGTLVSQMRAGAQPDAYFACDLKFLDMVRDRFEEGLIVSRNDIVLLVQRENPLGLNQLADLARPGLRVGLAHPGKSALGALSRDLLRRHSVEKPLEQSGNLTVLASKGDELVNQMQLGALDAALLYRSNALASPAILESCEIVPLTVSGSQASQPFALSRDSPHRQLLARLRLALTGPEGRAAFERFGFHWNLSTADASADSSSSR
ncbi:MAG TPA: molybdate ABC transporter substrate-binding protein [Verrucomicrobiales bacterium]|nr:molybdate ABC transporter substrate-binding protein [Verrucomicrobiales bacterium]